MRSTITKILMHFRLKTCNEVDVEVEMKTSFFSSCKTNCDCVDLHYVCVCGPFGYMWGDISWKAEFTIYRFVCRLFEHSLALQINGMCKCKSNFFVIEYLVHVRKLLLHRRMEYENILYYKVHTTIAPVMKMFSQTLPHTHTHTTILLLSYNGVSLSLSFHPFAFNRFNSLRHN